MEDGKFRVDKFNDQNFYLWKMKVEDDLYQQDIFLPLGGLANKSASMKDEKLEILNRKTPRTL